MAEAEERIELKFRIYDGTDIAHSNYVPSTTVATLKQRLVTEWPQDKSIVPKSVSDIKLIHAGKVLENSKTLSESRVHFGDLPGGVITMHVVVQPPVAKKKTGTVSLFGNLICKVFSKSFCKHMFTANNTLAVSNYSNSFNSYNVRTFHRSPIPTMTDFLYGGLAPIHGKLSPSNKSTH
ncbi:membrane-anchored ubiquitin-fold protein 4 precursor [Actinidia rufa]|uniref:Membrane-anchored ubiquitin-fold protein 4 n=1 Tax=Actinidia rufa TaxID=165716 RepID=A0A7J0GSF4_9ERIC|nr:membrane-anchored ubiquitin-fold protein 4 precursor [Actinidia rufa]